jgi:uncharacterized protein
MRAQANFIEQTPITLVLFALVEISGAGQHAYWAVILPVLGAAFMVGRVAHAFGMDGKFKPGRPIGMLTSYVVQLVLVVVAVLTATGKF